MSYKIGRNLEYLYVISVFPLGELWRMAHNLKTLRVVCLLSVGPDTNGVCPSLRDVQYECGRYTDGQGIVRELEKMQESLKPKLNAIALKRNCQNVRFVWEAMWYRRSDSKIVCR